MKKEPSKEQIKENYEKIKNAMLELKTNKIVSHKQIFDALKKSRQIQDS